MSEAVAVPTERDPDIDALQRLCYADAEFARRYEGWEPIGHGASATVVRVRLMGHPLALKIFTNLSDDGRARLRAEFASTVQLTSLYVVRTYSVFDRGAIAWLEMEAVDGPNLQHELEARQRDGRPFSREEALDIGIAVARALVEAHRQGVVHRDVKPANILLPRNGGASAKLGDFGVARAAGGARMTASGAFAGTARWAAPEAFAGRALGLPADVYSLSLCLFALFTGNGYPWSSEDEPSLEAYVAWHTRTAPTLTRWRIGGDLDAVQRLISSGLDKRASRRPSAADVLSALQGLREMPPVAVETRSSALAVGAGVKKWTAFGLCVAIVTVMAYFELRRAIATEPSVPQLEEQPRPADAVAEGRDSLPSSASRVASDQREMTLRIAGQFVVLEAAADGVKGDVAVVTQDGSTHHAKLSKPLAPYETLAIALEAFRPRITRAQAAAGTLRLKAYAGPATGAPIPP